MNRLVLASQSPRRRELLEKEGVELIVDPSKSEEVFDLSKGLDQGLLEVAIAKGREVLERHSHHLILSADTIVVDGETVLGKPKDVQEAFDTLKSLSGRVHEVKTAIVLQSRGFILGSVETTRVHFRDLSDEEIQAYVNEGSCLDKAGSYGIQDTDFVERYEGSYTNVVGLPMRSFWKMMDCVETMADRSRPGHGIRN